MKRNLAFDNTIYDMNGNNVDIAFGLSYLYPDEFPGINDHLDEYVDLIVREVTFKRVGD